MIALFMLRFVTKSDQHRSRLYFSLLPKVSSVFEPGLEFLKLASAEMCEWPDFGPLFLYRFVFFDDTSCS